MKKKVVGSGVVLCAALLAGGVFLYNKNDNKIKLDPDEPVVLHLCHYYNGMQQEIFDNLINDFNNTVGSKEGIIVETNSFGNINELTDSMLKSANNDVGADPMPDIFSAYADTAYEFDKMGILTDLSQYMTKEELDEYIESYIKEGYINNDDEFKLFPIAKSTETFILNETDWDKFAKETGADKSKLSTWEGIVDTAKSYYEWTDAQTPDIENDGKAFFGRDAFANYMIIGSDQLGTEIFKVDNGNVTLQIDDKVMKKLWDCYYVPYVNGWFGAYGKFRSDDIKTGQVISLVGSTSGALYFPSEVTSNDGSSYKIESGVYDLPNFEGTEPYAVQQGAGYVVVKSTPEKEYASTVFLKWFTQSENNIKFSINSGYLPVKKEANKSELLEKAMKDQKVNSLFQKVIAVGGETVSNYNLYTSKPFENANEARKVLEYNMPDAAAKALKKRDEMISKGTSRSKAVEELTNEDAFNEWLANFKTELEKVIEK